MTQEEIAAGWGLRAEDLQPFDYGRFLGIKTTTVIVGQRHQVLRQGDPDCWTPTDGASISFDVMRLCATAISLE